MLLRSVHTEQETETMTRTIRRIGAVVLVLVAMAAIAVPALARAGHRTSHHQDCVHALELADVGMRQLGALQPVDVAANVAFSTGQRAKGMRLTREYVAAVQRYAATMTAY